MLPYLGIFGGDGLMGLGRTALPAIESVTVENENIVQVKSVRFRGNSFSNNHLINVLSSNLYFFCSTGQRKSSNGASSAHVPECKAVSSK